jgi:hypothetical protein
MAYIAVEVHIYNTTKKRQMVVASGEKGLTAAEQFYSLVA